MEIHPTQLGILKRLLFKKSCRYTDLKIDPELENNTFQFHLNKMIKVGYVDQDEDGQYSLTKKGKQFATHVDTDRDKIVERRKVSVHLYCIRENEGEMEGLMYTRLKHPFYGKQGFPAGKVLHGENFKDAAIRELKEETNLEGDPVLFNIAHYLVKESDTKELLDDKLFLDFFIMNPTGELKGSDEGEYKWFPIKNIKEHILNPFDNVETYIKAFNRIRKFKSEVTFEELDHLTKDF